MGGSLTSGLGALTWRPLRLKRGMMRVNKKTGKVEGEKDSEGPLARFKELLEPTINATVLLNKGAPFAALAIWTLIQVGRPLWQLDSLLRMLPVLGLATGGNGIGVLSAPPPPRCSSGQRAAGT